jgi:Fur family peroxide stress response transcriptional regulator
MHDTCTNENIIVQALRNKGYKATPQRVTISKTVLCSREHPSVQRIYKEVKKTHPTVSLATVYQTLRILKESSLVQELNFEGQTRYDTNLKPHINLVCINCGKIEDSDNPAVKDMIKSITEKTKFLHITQRVEVYGICQACSKTTSKTKNKSS